MIERPKEKMHNVFKVFKRIYINARDERRDSKIAHENYLR